MQNGVGGRTTFSPEFSPSRKMLSSLDLQRRQKVWGAVMSDPRSASSSASADLLHRLRRGDEDAATAVFERYVERLTRLARSRLATKLASRVDPEDIVLSAYRSFFVAARQGRFELERGGDLWRL